MKQQVNYLYRQQQQEELLLELLKFRHHTATYRVFHIKCLVDNARASQTSCDLKNQNQFLPESGLVRTPEMVMTFL
jgi:hypothetical protein